MPNKLKLLITTLILVPFMTGCSNLISLISLFQPPKEQSQDIKILFETEIPHTSFVLENGLKVIVQEDNSDPIVSVHVWYHVGSKDEAPGKTGFAHLFEHLMFNGSGNFNDDYFKVLESIGGSNVNGTTNRDRTNYYQTVPISALDTVLWMESDRMGYLLDAIDQAKLDEQRDVVLKEKQQNDNQPYGTVRNTIIKHTYKENHPYSWPTIGSEEDIKNATLEDVQTWFQSHYGPNNATLVMSGNITPEIAREKAQKYFGAIPATLPQPHAGKRVSKMSENTRHQISDDVAQTKWYRTWNIPAIGEEAFSHLDLISNILSAGKHSRLHQLLIHEEQLVTDVAAYVYVGEMGGQFIIETTLKPDTDIDAVETLIEAELERILRYGYTTEELERAQIFYITDFIKQTQTTQGKASLLSFYQTLLGSANAYQKLNNMIKETTLVDLSRTTKTWLSDGNFTLEVLPYPRHSNDQTDVDRSSYPTVNEFPSSNFPDIQRTTLENGLEILFVPHRDTPITEVKLILDAGYSSDSFGIPGTAKIALDLLDEGTRSMSSIEMSKRLNRLGATITTGSNLDISAVSLSTLSTTFDESLELFGDVIKNPAFPEDEFERLRSEQKLTVQQENTRPFSLGIKHFPALLYGEQHPYSVGFTGSGTEQGLDKITLNDIELFYKTWFDPSKATLIVAGDLEFERVETLMKNMFGSWEKAEQTEVQEKTYTAIPEIKPNTVHVIDIPYSLQSTIVGGQLMPKRAHEQHLEMAILNTVIGGDFTSRLNMNLREDKGWTYNASSYLVDTAVQRPLIVISGVQIDQTGASIQEIIKELSSLQSTSPLTFEEIDTSKQNQILKQPGRFETVSDLIGSTSNLVRFGLDDDFYNTLSNQIKAINLETTQSVADQYLTPGEMTWLVITDLNITRSQLEKLFDEIIILEL